jgi:DNA-binding MarR family transcriptional regulator
LTPQPGPDRNVGDERDRTGISISAFPVERYLLRGMMGKKFKASQFVQLSTKVFYLGLNSIARDVLFAIVAHSGKNGDGIRPSYNRIMELTGLSRHSVARAIKDLGDARILEWERGAKGRANVYRVTPYGVWKPVCHTDYSTSLSQALPQSATQTTGSLSQRLQPYPLNHNQEPRDGLSTSQEEGIADPEAKAKAIKKIRELTTGMKGIP